MAGNDDNIINGTSNYLPPRNDPRPVGLSGVGKFEPRSRSLTGLHSRSEAQTSSNRTERNTNTVIRIPPTGGLAHPATARQGQPRGHGVMTTHRGNMSLEQPRQSPMPLPTRTSLPTPNTTVATTGAQTDRRQQGKHQSQPPRKNKDPMYYRYTPELS